MEMGGVSVSSRYYINNSQDAGTFFALGLDYGWVCRKLLGINRERAESALSESFLVTDRRTRDSFDDLCGGTER